MYHGYIKFLNIFTKSEWGGVHEVGPVVLVQVSSGKESRMMLGYVAVGKVRRDWAGAVGAPAGQPGLQAGHHRPGQVGDRVLEQLALPA